jgi:hypothetical protein
MKISAVCVCGDAAGPGAVCLLANAVAAAADLPPLTRSTAQLCSQNRIDLLLALFILHTRPRTC